MNRTGLKETFMESSSRAKVKIAWANGEKVQYKIGDEWKDWVDPNCLRLGESLWRVKPKVLNINGHDVPTPLRAPKSGRVFVVNMFMSQNSSALQEAYDIGVVHESAEAAQAHIDALLSFTKEKK